MSYAQPSDMLLRYDQRVLGDLCGDAGQRIPSDLLLTNATLQAMLDDGSSTINAAALVGNRYAVADLDGLTGDDRAYLIRLNCDLAYGMLRYRRGLETESVPQYQQALTTLDQLRDGERVFNVQATLDAGDATAEFPSMTTISQVNLARDYAAKLFPARRTQRVSP